MPEIINLRDILQNRIGMKLWSPMHPELYVTEVNADGIRVDPSNLAESIQLDDCGRLWPEGECLIWPSKQEQDWSRYLNTNNQTDETL